MVNDDILELLRRGEDSVVEFKAMSISGRRVAEPDAKDVADEIAAAANTVGATFLFGVDDRTRCVAGLPPERLDVAETWVRDICNDAVKPAVVAVIRKVSVRTDEGGERFVLRVDVPKSLFVHESPHGYFHRIGSSKRKMPPEMLARLFQQRSQTRLVCFDEQVVAGADIGELKRELFSRFRTALSSADDVEFLRKLHLVAPDDSGILRPTVTGVLFATEHPEAHLPSAYVQAVCYRGTERNADQQLDARDITGPLDAQIAEACHFVKRNMRIAAIKDPARIDIPQFAMSAVFEAVVNAVAHRDYSISGAKIRVHLFADRLEIFSPGGLPNSLTLDEIGERQFARNELICTCLARCPLPGGLTDVARSRIMDRRGEGVPVIFAQTEKLSGSRPCYRLFNDSELLLTIRSVPLGDAEALHRIVEARGVEKEEGPRAKAKGEGGANSGIGGANGGIGGANGDVGGANGGIGGANPSILEIIAAHPGQRVPFLAKAAGRTEKSVEHEIKALKNATPPKIEFRGATKSGGYYLWGEGEKVEVEVEVEGGREG